MLRRFQIFLLIGASLAASVILTATQQTPPPARDVGSTASPARVGRSSITGNVVDMTSGSPVRRVTVTASEQGGGGSRVSVTDDDGRFAFNALPAGRYTISAVKPAYLSGAYGLSRVPRAGMSATGTAIALGEAHAVTDIAVKISRGAVVAGTVRGMDGRPMRGATVALAYPIRAVLTGDRTVTTLGGGSATTDTKGEYRIFGVPPGEYIVSARMPPFSATATNDLERTTEDDLRRIADLIAGRTTVAAGSTAAAAEAPRRPTYGYSTVFYPGTTSLSSATPITVGPGEERGGVDLALQLVPQSRVSGVLTGLDGKPGVGSYVSLVSATTTTTGPFLTQVSATTGAQGEFTLRGVPAGDYVIEARAQRTGPGPLTANQTAWARESVSVASGADQRINLTMRPSLTISGQVTIEGDPGAAPPDFSRMTLLLMNLSGSAGRGAVAPDGQFTIEGILPGKARFGGSFPATPTAPPSSAWFIKSATLAGQEAMDSFVDLNASARNASIVITNRMSELSGAILDGAGKPAPEFVVIVFPADRALWTWQTRRILQVRPSHDGKFIFKGLPPGEYMLGAATDVEQYQWFDPAFLTELAGGSVKLVLVEGEKKVQDIRLR